MRVLGIETSCDETAAAVVDAEGHVLADVVHSQIAAHAPYGGIVPEIASRDHVRAIVPVIRRALATADVALRDLDGIAVTSRPGLSGALLVGLSVAQGLAWAADRPLVAVDHLVGHLLAVFLRHPGADAPRPSFPYLGLLVSGGHTALYRVDGPTPDRIRELGATRDDAAGEAFDKIAKLLGLGYPGGPVVDRLAAGGDAQRAIAALPRAAAHANSLEFSFSGLKSAVARHVAVAGRPDDPQGIADLCAAFQGSVVATLVRKTLLAAERESLGTIVLAGGVAANRELRRRLGEAAARRGLTLCVPPFASCTDNAAMIAWAGLARLQRGERDPLGISPATRTVLPRVTRKGGGVRPPRDA